MRRQEILSAYPSASKLSLAACCVAPWTQGYERTEQPSEDADRGTALHKAFAAIALGMSPTDARDLHEIWPGAGWEMLEHVFAAVAEDLRSSKMRAEEGDVCSAVWMVEQGVLYDPTDGSAGFCDRSPGEELEGRFAGTADLVYLRNDGTLVVADWKTGAQQARLEDPESHWQLWTLALAFARALRHAGPVRLELRHVSSDGVRVDTLEVSPAELLGHELRLGELAARLQSYARPTPGPWCRDRRCPCLASCPAQAQLVRELAADIAREYAPEVTLAPVLDGDSARRLITLRRAVGDWAELADERIRAYLIGNPSGVKLYPGVKLVARASTREAANDTAAGIEALLDYFEERCRDEATEGQAKMTAIKTIRSFTKGSVEKALNIIAAAETAGIKSSSDRARAKKSIIKEGLERLRAAGVLIAAGTSYRIVTVKGDVEADTDGEGVEE